MDTTPKKKKRLPWKSQGCFVWQTQSSSTIPWGISTNPTGNLWATHNAKISTFSTAVRCEVQSTIRQCWGQVVRPERPILRFNEEICWPEEMCQIRVVGKFKRISIYINIYEYIWYSMDIEITLFIYLNQPKMWNSSPSQSFVKGPSLSYHLSPYIRRDNSSCNCWTWNVFIFLGMDVENEDLDMKIKENYQRGNYIMVTVWLWSCFWW